MNSVGRPGLCSAALAYAKQSAKSHAVMESEAMELVLAWQWSLPLRRTRSGSGVALVAAKGKHGGAPVGKDRHQSRGESTGARAGIRLPTALRDYLFAITRSGRP